MILTATFALLHGCTAVDDNEIVDFTGHRQVILYKNPGCGEEGGPSVSKVVLDGSCGANSPNGFFRIVYQNEDGDLKGTRYLRVGCPSAEELCKIAEDAGGFEDPDQDTVDNILEQLKETTPDMYLSDYEGWTTIGAYYLTSSTSSCEQTKSRLQQSINMRGHAYASEKHIPMNDNMGWEHTTHLGPEFMCQDFFTWVASSQLNAMKMMLKPFRVADMWNWNGEDGADRPYEPVSARAIEEVEAYNKGIADGTIEERAPKYSAGGALPVLVAIAIVAAAYIA